MTVGKRSRALGMAAALMALAGCGGVVAGEVEGGAADAAPAADSDDGSTDGITVHGHWRLDVMNADGTLDQTVEFENALTNDGAQFLERLLVEKVIIDGFHISIDDLDDGSGPCAVGLDSYECGEIAMVTDDELTADGLTLAANFSVSNAVEIGLVSTLISFCRVELSSDCTDPLSPRGPVFDTFTSKLATDDPTDTFEPIPVTAGQIVQVTVVISFS